jgi:hypothetical protein
MAHGQDECRRIADEDEQKRQELSQRFQVGRPPAWLTQFLYHGSPHDVASFPCENPLSHFQTTIDEITAKMGEDAEAKARHAHDNEEYGIFALYV